MTPLFSTLFNKKLKEKSAKLLSKNNQLKRVIASKDSELNNKILIISNNIDKNIKELKHKYNKYFDSNSEKIDNMFLEIRDNLEIRVNENNDLIKTKKEQILKSFYTLKNDIAVIKRNRDDSLESLIKTLSLKLSKVNDRINKYTQSNKSNYQNKIEQIELFKKEIYDMLEEENKQSKKDENIQLDFFEKVLNRLEYN